MNARVWLQRLGPTRIERRARLQGFEWVYIACFLLTVAAMSASMTTAAPPAVPPAPAAIAAPAPAQAAEPIVPLPASVALDVKRVELGARLFTDTRLSADGTRSCATCHPVERGAMDGNPRASTNDGVARMRNTPTLFNVAFNYSFNWDGATTTLEQHARRLLADPWVMHVQWPALLQGLRDDVEYQTRFVAAYPDGITEANVLDALAEYERSLVTPNARIDRYLRGERDALTTEELHGYRLFKSYGCAACHQGINVGGNLFQKFGVFQDPGTSSAPGQAPDLGRFGVTGNERDRGVFRVPSLRNVALTAPYFHDGRAPTLEVAVEIMGRVQLGRPLAAEEVRAIVQFLGTLTGEYQGKPLTREGW